MDLIVLDTSLNEVAIVDIYESLIWTDRFCKPGDFELYATVTKGLLEQIKEDRYLACRDSEHAMIVESIRINTDVEDGNHLTITGRSLESILDRRIIWGKLDIRGNLQDGVRTLLNDCIIEPSDPDRKIDNFVFKESTDPAITNLTISAQYTGKNLLSVVETICSDNNIGFKVTLSNSKQFVFELYAGVDRSYDQTKNPYVIFSPQFDNIINSNYIESKSALKTVALIGGEGEGSARRYASVGGGVGLDRREIFTDARDISSDVGDGKTLSNEEYEAALQQRGRETLDENKSVTSFEGQVETVIMYKYGEDFFNGDVVQIMNEYGHESKVRILEIVMSDDKDGFSVYPTFSTIVIEDTITKPSGGGGQTEYDPVFANNSWEAIIDACEKSAVPNTWVVGNSKAMTIGGTDYFIDIIGKNHDTYATGGVAPLTFQMRSCYGTTYPMNGTGSNVGGWTDCSMRNTHLPGILSQMPEDVRANVKEVNKTTSVGNASTTMVNTADKLFLLSEVEVFGATNYSAAGEGYQYDYYSAGNSAVKELGGTASYWWLRSPRSSNATAYCRVNGSGNYAQSAATTSCGVAFAFCF